MIGRWGRAARALRSGSGRMLDVGCAFGFGTAMLQGPGREVHGMEASAGYLATAHGRYPGLRLVRGDATRLPYRDGRFDALTMLDVLEHVPDPAAAVAEARRVLAPGGLLVLTVPHAGLLAGWDSLNVYSRWVHRFGWPPVDPTERGFPEHRHFSIEEIEALLDGFAVERVVRTGLGIAEPVNLGLMALCRGLLRSEALYRLLRWLYFGLYLVEDAVPLGRAGYHLMVVARRMPVTLAEPAVAVNRGTWSADGQGP